MKIELRVIGLMFIVLLLAACSKDGESPEGTQPVINIYVYSPNNPTVTRGDVGNVDPINNDLNESLITSLQIWVFKHGTEELVSYYQPETVRNLNEDKGVTYQLIVSDDFSKADPKPNVDVYVVANAASCGLSSLGKSTTRTALEDAKIGSAYFGLSPLTDKVPEAGLPMSGVLRDVAVTGMAPVFKISSVTLTRTVSKLRFIFSRDDGNTVKITSIKLGAVVDSENHETTLSQIPTEEYMFLKADHSIYHIGNTYVDGGTELLPDDSPLREDIKTNEDPLKYAYQPGQNAQDYENLIALGLSENKLSGVGPYYLRESDKKLSGVITYQKGNAEETMKATFEMKAAGDFSRNHTWIIYAYYGVDGMQVVTVYSQNWTEVTSESHDVYNW